MQRKKQAEADPVKVVLAQMEKAIKKDYGTMEKFAYGTDAIQKSTLSRLMKDRQDCRVSTLKAIARGLGKKLVIRME